MSRYKQQPIEVAGLHTIPIATRGGKVRVDAFAEPHQKGGDWITFLSSLPNILAADSLRAVIDALIQARSKGRAIIWGLGGHVIKTGLAPVLIDLMNRGFATAFAMNGSAAIHDFEIAIAGATSEDVEAVLPDGTFGTAEETGHEMNHALDYGMRHELGAGEAYGRRLAEIARPEFRRYSLLHAAYELAIPVTVHIAVGTDTPHTHPAAGSGAAIGACSLRDFRLFSTLVQELEGGGVYLNVGSAVVMPEVFLKAVSTVRNLGNPLDDFTTVNLDFLQHYRPKANVVQRPHAGGMGQGYSLTGHHEIMIPLLAAALVECAAE